MLVLLREGGTDEGRGEKIRKRGWVVKGEKVRNRDTNVTLVSFSFSNKSVHGRVPAK